MVKVKTRFQKYFLKGIILFLVIIGTIVNSNSIAQAAKIKISQTKATLYEGDTLQLKMIGTDTPVKWSSNKKEIATVSQKGKVTSKNEGVARITATVNNKKYVCEITVKEKIELGISLYIGDELNLIIIGTDGDTKWKTSDRAIATVSKEGKVTAKNKGIAIISASVDKVIYSYKIIVLEKETDDKNEVLITPTPTPTPTPTLSSTPDFSGSIKSLSELEAFLIKNFSTLDTCIGTATFTFNIYENDKSHTEYDYWIQVKYDYDFFGGAMSSIKYTDNQKNQLRSELKAHQESLGKAVIAAMPDKKFYGGYFDSWYRYPTLKIELITRRYYSWKNYDDVSYLLVDLNQRYNSTKPSGFRWYSLIDDEL